MDYSIDAVREPDGRWVATLPHIPGLVVYEQSQEEALDSARKLSAILLGEDMGGRRENPRFLSWADPRIRAAGISNLDPRPALLASLGRARGNFNRKRNSQPASWLVKKRQRAARTPKLRSVCQWRSVFLTVDTRYMRLPLGYVHEKGPRSEKR